MGANADSSCVILVPVCFLGWISLGVWEQSEGDLTLSHTEVG